MVQTNDFFQTVNKKYSEVNKTQLATKLLKEHTDIEEAVVNILGSTGIAGFKFHIPKREQIKMQAEATDHYIDTNRPVQDHIALKPVTITLNGLHGDYFYSVNQIEDMLAAVVPTLSLVKQFLPKLSDATKQIKTAYQKNLEIQKLVNKDIADLAGGSDIYYKDLDRDDKTRSALDAVLLNRQDLFSLAQQLYKLKSAQTRAFFFFEALWKSRAIFSVETTYRRYDNMVITSATPLRDENADITDFTLTFKQLNFTTSLYKSYENVAGRLRQQLAQTANKGLDKGREVPTT